MIWQILGQRFYRDINVLNNKDRFEIFYDIKDDIRKGNLARGVPPTQTTADIFQRHSNKNSWDNLQKFFKTKIKEYTNKNAELVMSWANLSDEENDFVMHEHKSDLTCIYYIKGKRYEYGTDFGSFIIPFVENSTLIVDGRISHSIINMPYELAHQKLNHRYTLVFDFNYVI
jgi:hypothetical protein